MNDSKDDWGAIHTEDIIWYFRHTTKKGKIHGIIGAAVTLILAFGIPAPLGPMLAVFFCFTWFGYMLIQITIKHKWYEWLDLSDYYDQLTDEEKAEVDKEVEFYKRTNETQDEYYEREEKQ